MSQIIHLISHPVSAKRFVEPLVQRLLADGQQAELWVEPVARLDSFYFSLDCPKRTATFNLCANPWRMLMGAIGLWRMLCKRRPDIVQAHLMRGALIPLLVAWLLRVPVRIYHNHGVPFVGYRGPLRWGLWLIEWLDCCLATHVLTVSKGMREILVGGRLVEAGKCQVLGAGSACGIDLTEFSMPTPLNKSPFKIALGLPPNAFVVFYVGRPHLRKGFDLVLSVWARTFVEGGACLLLAGIERQDVARVLPEAPGNIWPLGYLGDLRPYYAAADVVVLPSEHEGFGYSLLEGAAMGCSLVASRIPGPDAIVQENKSGYLIAAGDVDGLASVLLRLAENKALCCHLGENAQNGAKKFERNALCDIYAKYIRRILAQLQ